MIQDLWFFDFFSLLMVRFSLSYYYFKEALSLKQKKEKTLRKQKRRRNVSITTNWMVILFQL